MPLLQLSIPYRPDGESGRHASFRVGDEFSCGAKRLFDDELYAYDVGRRLRILARPFRAMKRNPWHRAPSFRILG